MVTPNLRLLGHHRTDILQEGRLCDGRNNSKGIYDR